MSFDQMLDVVSFLLVCAVAFVAYRGVGKIPYIAQLSTGLRHGLTAGAGFLSFVAAVLVVRTQAFRLLFGAGVTLFGLGLLVAPLYLIFK